ncbi:MAG: PAS domain S-box protein [Chryseobacterium sp.]|nr:MAG: PAS domain S-box protein [Chryseobacterium sp.]
MHKKLLLLTDMVTNAPFPMAVYLGDDLIIECANPEMVKAWGKGTNVLGKKYLDVVPEIQKQQIYDQALNAYKTGTAFHAKDKRVDLEIDGVLTSYYFNYSYIPLFDKQGRVYGIMNTGLDVTDLHLAHQQLRLSNERLRIAVDASGMGTYEIDLATKKIKTSHNFNSIWGIDPGQQNELTNEILIARMHPEDLDIRDRAFSDGNSTGLINYELRIRNATDYRWIKVNAKIIQDDSDHPATIIGITQDVHQQKEFEQELQKQVAANTQELTRSNEDLLHFAHIVSHDLREPVRKIKFFNGLLQNQASMPLNEKLQRYALKVDQSADRMKSIIEGILTYSTINSSRHPIGNIDLNSIMEYIKTDLELSIEEKQAKISVGMLPGVEGAPILIHQLFYNLVQNSLKFSRPGISPRIEITSVPSDKEEFVTINVRDNGIGLDPQYADKIFSAFERLHSKDSYEGNGLGLSLCRKIVLRHHGSITAAGQEGVGADFTIILPRKQSYSSI